MRPTALALSAAEVRGAEVGGRNCQPGRRPQDDLQKLDQNVLKGNDPSPSETTLLEKPARCVDKGLGINLGELDFDETNICSPAGSGSLRQLNAPYDGPEASAESSHAQPSFSARLLAVRSEKPSRVAGVDALASRIFDITLRQEQELGMPEVSNASGSGLHSGPESPCGTVEIGSPDGGGRPPSRTELISALPPPFSEATRHVSVDRAAYMVSVRPHVIAKRVD